ncbi:MAG: GMP synthase [Gammaproteobacteria bacterium]|nr:GMP synthase [Gammaproteobacteria bacterium]
MKNYAIIQHNYSEFLGLIESQLEKRDIGFNYFRPFVGQDLPGSALQFDAMFLLGGHIPSQDRENMPWLESEKNLIGIFEKSKRPVVGIGMGGLLVAEFYGATPVSEPLHNAYWTTAHITSAGKQDLLAQSVDGKKVLVMFNGDASLPEGLEPLLVDDYGHWIAIRPNELVYGLLFRPELKPGMIEDMIMEAGRSTPDHIGDILQQARDEWETSQRTTDAVIVALVKALDLMTERKKPPVFRINVES